MATLFEIYKTKGKQLPDMPERFKDQDFLNAANKAGITSDLYTGTEEQNNAIARYMVPSTITTSSAPRQELVKNTQMFNEALRPMTELDRNITDTITRVLTEINVHVQAFQMFQQEYLFGQEKEFPQ